MAYENPPAYDFYSPFVAARIVTAKGAPYALWTDLGGTGQLLNDSEYPEGLKGLPYLSDLTVEIQNAYDPIMTATLSPTFLDARTLMNSELLEWAQATLEVQFGYTGGAPGGPKLSAPFSGIIIPPEITLGSETTVTLKAQGTGDWSATHQQSSNVWSNTKRRDILAALIKGPDPANPRDWTPIFSDVDPNSESAKLLDTPVNLAQGYYTDMAMIWSILRECQCLFFSDGKKIRIMSQNKMFSGTPKYTLSLYDFPSGQVGPSVGTFPILNVSSASMHVFASGALRAQVYGGMSSENRKVVQGLVKPAGVDIGVPGVPASEVAVQTTGGGGAFPAASSKNPGLNPQTGDGGGNTQHDVNHKDFEAKTHADYAAAQPNSGVQLEVDTLGIPDLFPGDVVSVRGIGLQFDHNYAVLKAIHHVGAGGYTMHLQLVANSTNTLDNVTKYSGKTNTAQPAVGSPEVTVTATDFGSIANSLNRSIADAVFNGVDPLTAFK